MTNRTKMVCDKALGAPVTLIGKAAGSQGGHLESHLTIRGPGLNYIRPGPELVRQSIPESHGEGSSWQQGSSRAPGSTLELG